MPYDPTKAEEPVPLPRINTMRCIANEIITAKEALDRGRFYQKLPDRLPGDAPFWDFYFEALDARWARDDKPLSWNAASKLYKVDGKKQDNSQRPYLVSMGFAGLNPPISVFPGDPEGKFEAWCNDNTNDNDIGSNPSYDASQVVGRVFDCEEKELERKNFKLRYLIPRVVHPEGYLFTEEVRTLGSADSDDAAPATNNAVDIAKPGGEEELAKLLAAIDGKPVNGEFFDIIRAAGMDNTTLLNGESLTGAALDTNKFIETLQELGHVAPIDGDRIALA